jgi:uncharacterized protein (DUF305 family)
MKYLALLALLLLTTPALAEKMDHSMMKHGSSDASASTKAYEESMETMHKGMMVPYTGDADLDFVRGMIPHHQGAVDMCKIQLEYGKDKEIRKLCKGIIGSQEKEIGMMKAWLKKRGDP